MGKRLLLLGLLAGFPVRGALLFNATFDASITSDLNAVAIQNTINSGMALFQALFSDSITVNLHFQATNTGLGNASVSYLANNPYATVISNLAAQSSSADDATAVSTLQSNPLGIQNVNLTTANARALGICSVTCSPVYDGIISLNLSLMNLTRSGPQDPLKYDLLSVVLHEIDHVLGTSSGLQLITPVQFIADFYRYDANGNRVFTKNSSTASYLSFDGTTQLAQFEQGGIGDYGDFLLGGPLHVQNAFGTPGAQPDLGVEVRFLDVVGYDLAVPEPSTVSMLLAGLAALVAFRRRHA